MIRFFTEDIYDPKLPKRKVKKWISQIAEYHKFKAGDINYIFCSNEYILEINNQYLSHNYYTDIITFNYNSRYIISGDIYISLETVKQNSLEYNVDFKEELYRVIIHGILHLVGFDDSTDIEKDIMRQQENQALLQIQL